ncbi:MAG: 4-(cytidine 5'-diphospho)-2-C-methyl-D-erythritol kinase, partial [Alphaproteobacteria bacterium]
MSDPATQSLSVTAAAKLNLWLRVLGRRDDGYHCLDSLVGFVEWHDTLTLHPAAAVELTVSGPEAAGLAAGDATGDNLVLRAARDLRALCGVTAGVRIHLDKHIPVAAGLGGGSADAAAVLRGLCRLWRISPPAPALDAVALALGADVPVCLRARPARVGGTGGSVVTGPDLPGAWVVLVNPRLPVATAAVFAAYQPAAATPGGAVTREPLAPAGTVAELAAQCRRIGNDLTAAAIAVAPAIGTVLSVLAEDRHALISAMTGSGGTCFALYES